MGRPRKYASAAERQKAFRSRYEIVEARVIPETAATLTRLAAQLDVPRTEVVNSMINFALLNRNWFVLGLFGKRLPYYSGEADTSGVVPELPDDGGT